jgi:hypothetical protein
MDMAGIAVTAVYIGGALHLLFVVFHLFFWRLFDWPNELAKLSPLNARVVPVLNISLIVVFLGAAYVSFSFAGEVVGTALGRGVSFAVALFWLARLVQQFIFFGLRKPFSWVLSFFCVVMAVIYALPTFAV